jgi:hypothetical protein
MGVSRSAFRAVIFFALFLMALGQPASAGTCRDILLKIFTPLTKKIDRRLRS